VSSPSTTTSSGSSIGSTWTFSKCFKVDEIPTEIQK
jgi:hypothetical protein